VPLFLTVTASTKCYQPSPACYDPLRATRMEEQAARYVPPNWRNVAAVSTSRALTNSRMARERRADRHCWRSHPWKRFRRQRRRGGLCPPTPPGVLQAMKGAHRWPIRKAGGGGRASPTRRAYRPTRPCASATTVWGCPSPSIAWQVARLRCPPPLRWSFLNFKELFGSRPH
jgi:hypothetical protein